VAAAWLAACSADTEASLLASARAYLARGDTTTALIEIKRALGANAGSAEARLLLGQTLLQTGDMSTAELELRKALELGGAEDRVLPDLARAVLLSGKPDKVIQQFGASRLPSGAGLADLKTWVASAYAQMGDQVNTQAALDQALAAVPLHPAAVLVRARLLARDGLYDAALALLDQVLAKDPTNALVGAAKGQLLLLGKNDEAGALVAHQAVLAANPTNPAALAETATILFRQGREQEAREQVKKLQAAAPKHAEAQFFEAQFAYVDKDYPKAREVTAFLLKVVPDHVRALELAAATELQLGNDEQAQALASRAIKVIPDLRLARQVLARSLLRAGQPAKALDALAPLVKTAGGDAGSHLVAGQAYLQLGDTKRADAAFANASKLTKGDAKARTEVAVALLAAGRTGAAMSELQAVSSSDQSGKSDVALVNARIGAGDLKGALLAADALQAKQPAKPFPYQLRGQIELAQRNAAAARKSFEAALGKDPLYYPAVAALASLDAREGKLDQAKARLLKLVEKSPQRAQALTMLALLPSPGGAPSPDAAQRLADAVRANPRDPKAHLRLIAKLLQLEDRASALTAAQAAVAALPNDRSLLDALGQAQMLAGETQQALSTFRKLATSQPTSATAQMTLAEALLAAKDMPGATAALKSAIALDPSLASAHQALARLAVQANRHEDAQAMARELQKRFPKSGLGWEIQGDVESALKNWPAASGAYKAALLRAPDSSDSAIKLHSSMISQGQAAEAATWAQAWDQAHPKAFAFQLHLANVATEARDYAAAESRYRKVLAAQPGNALVMNNIAWLLLTQGKPGALEMARKASQLLPNRAPILDTLAAAMAAENDFAGAAAVQRAAVKNAKADPFMRLALARYLVKADKKSEARAELEELAKLGDRFAKQSEVRQTLDSL
jgi:putative PEP-CTERM system TPR-repeat lipoprotein